VREDGAGPSLDTQLNTNGAAALRNALRAADPTANLNDTAMQRLIMSIGSAGFRPWPPLLGSEGLSSELRHPDATCAKCKQPLSANLAGSTQATLIDCGGIILKQHVPMRCRTAGTKQNLEGKCELFGDVMWHNYTVSNGKHLYRGRPHEQACFMLTSTFGFTTRYLQELHLRMVRQHISFAGEAFVQHELAAISGMQNHVPGPFLRQYLSDGWFKWRLLRRMAKLCESGLPHMSPETVDLKAHVEDCVKPCWPSLLERFEHASVENARKRGANTKVVALDGNQKNRRTCCGAPFQHHLRNAALQKCLRLPCPHTPRLGSTFCKEHKDWEEDVLEKTGITILEHKLPGPVLAGDMDTLLFKVESTSEDGVQEAVWTREIELHPKLVEAYFAKQGLESLRKAAARKIEKPKREAAWRMYVRRAMADISSMWEALTPEEREETLALHSADADLTAVACGTHKEGSKEKTLHAQTAGILCGCLSDGTVVRMREIFGAESLSQRYFFTSDLKASIPELSVIVHDDACHLHKFAEARASESAQAGSICPGCVRYVCDVFHMTGHTDAWCLAHCHPEAPDVRDLMQGVRTSVCEFTFTWLSQYKHQSKHMNEFSFQFFLLEMLDTHNEFVARGCTEHLPRARRAG